MIRHPSRLGLIVAPLVGAAIFASTLAVLAADRPTLRGDVVAHRDALTLGELIDNAPAALAETPLFRSPALGQNGTIQARRIVEAAEALGIGPVETGGRLQVSILRAARQVGPSEIEAALKTALQGQVGLDPRSTGISFDGTPPALTLAPDTKGAAMVSDLLYDRRNRRLSATVWIGPTATERRGSVRVIGSAVEIVEVAVLTRSLDRGEAVKPSDIAIERRPRDAISSDTLLDGAPLDGRVARRALAPGNLVRNGDLVRPELVARGEIVTVVYESPGMMLSMRAKASEAGALGDSISVVNSGTKKAVQATIVGPGKVSVSAGPAARVVAAAAPAERQP